MMTLRATPGLCSFTVVLLTLAVSTRCPAAGAKSDDDCSNKKSALAKTLCGDPEVAELDKWAAEAYRDSLAEAGQRRDAVQREQKEFVVERDKCLPKPPVAVAQTKASSEAEGATISEQPSGVLTENAAPGNPGAADSQKPPDAAEQAPAAADEEEEPQQSPEETLACLRKAYQARITVLEQKLRRFVDLSSDVPAAGNICAAVDALHAQGRLKLLARHAIVLTPVDEANEMHPAHKAAHLRRYLTDTGWNAAAGVVPTWNSGLGSVTILRAPLEPGQPPSWILTTIAGESRDRSLLLFEGDNTSADRLFGYLGGDGAGAFDPMFVRFKGQAFAVEQIGPAASTAPTPAIYGLDQSKPVCPAATAAR